jgi:polysaccharide deacetylase family protein (PEP-CTERM system associated)
MGKHSNVTPQDSQKLRFAFSVDVEDWFNSSLDLFDGADSTFPATPDPSVVVNTRACLDALDISDSKATFFILTTVCKHYPDLIREIAGRGHEVAAHGYCHRLLYKMTEDEFRRDLEISLELLAAAGISRVHGFRAPYWSITRKSLWALDILSDFGFRYDSSIFPIRRRLYGIADAPRHPYEIRNGLWEFPPATYRALHMNVPIAGGGYLRLVPPIILRPMIEAIRRRDEVGVFYCHPYEFDPQDVHAKVQLRGISSLLHYAQQVIGRKDNPRRLREFIARHRFTTICSLLDELRQK